MLKSLYGKFAWHGNRWLLRNLWLLNLAGGRLTVIDHFGAPGDTLMTANVCHIVKQTFRRLRINCVTRNPDLVASDPAIAELNAPIGFCHLAFEYLGIVDSRAKEGNILAASLSMVGIRRYRYKARVYLTDQEIAEARKRLPADGKSIITINVMSKEAVKVWRLDYWSHLIEKLVGEFTVIQLGDDREPVFPGVIPFGGKLNKRESMAMLALAVVHVGPDSFLMHAANGLDVPSVIIYGGSRPSACLGYQENRNLYVELECSPCWLHNSRGENCQHSMKCMGQISVNEVYGAVQQLSAKPRPALNPSCPQLAS